MRQTSWTQGYLMGQVAASSEQTAAPFSHQTFGRSIGMGFGPLLCLGGLLAIGLFFFAPLMIFGGLMRRRFWHHSRDPKDHDFMAHARRWHETTRRHHCWGPFPEEAPNQTGETTDSPDPDEPR